MRHATQILVSYALTLGGIGGFAAWMLRRGRRLSAQVPTDERSWT